MEQGDTIPHKPYVAECLLVVILLFSCFLIYAAYAPTANEAPTIILFDEESYNVDSYKYTNAIILDNATARHRFIRQILLRCFVLPAIIVLGTFFIKPSFFVYICSAIVISKKNSLLSTNLGGHAPPFCLCSLKPSTQFQSNRIKGVIN